MHIQIVTFQLDGISEADYRRQCEALAPVFAELPGLIAKVWLADPATNTFGGVYTWQNRGAMERYLASDLYAGMVTHPHLAGVTTRDFAVLTEPTRVTRGLAPGTGNLAAA